MKKNIIIGIIIFLIIAAITTTIIIILNEKDKKNNTTDENKIEYKIKEVASDCNLKDISFVNYKLIIAEGKVYEYSDKKYIETDTHCKLISPENSNKTYNYLGFIYGEKITDGIDIYDYHNNELIKTDSSYYKEELEKYKNNDYKYIDYVGGLNDEILKLIPEDEKILYVANICTESESCGYIKYITDKGVYEYRADENDKCYEYEDVECTKKLFKTDELDPFLQEFKDNISFYDGLYLATKNNKIYRIAYYNFNFDGKR